MKNIQFNSHSSAEIIPCDTIEACARQTSGSILRGHIALSGGSTFEKICAVWATLNLSFDNPLFFPVDERVVSFTDTSSNWGMIHKNFLVPCGFADQKSHFAESAECYGKMLLSEFQGGFPVFDTIFLGVGADGHTASLFPHSDDLNDTTAIVLSTTSPQPPFHRISLGPAVIAAAENVLVIITGKSKKSVFTEITRNNSDLPIVGILSQRKHSKLFVDRECFL